MRSMQTIDPYSPLTRAARNGNANEVRALLSKGINVNSRDYGNQTALEVAAWNGRLEVVNLLLANGANINLAGKNDFIPLMAAIEHPDVVRALLARGADVNAKITNGKTALMMAAEKNSETVQLLVEQGADINAQDNEGTTALMYACSWGRDAKIVEVLLKPRDGKPRGSKRAWWGIFARNSNVVKAKDKIDVNAKDKSGRTALDQVKDAEVKALLVAAGARGVRPAGNTSPLNNDLFGAVERSDAAAVQALLADGADVNAVRSFGGATDQTVLMEACRRGQYEIVQALLASGAAVNAKRSDGDTALMQAAFDGRHEIVKALLAKGADVNARARDTSALALAYQFHRHDVVQTLRDAGSKDDYLLISAAIAGDVALVHSLLAEGANVNIRDTVSLGGHSAGTPLIKAASGGHLEIVRGLLAKGADVNARLTGGNMAGGTALMEASSNGHLPVVLALLEHGADINAQNSYGVTALMWACRSGRRDVVQALLAKGDVNARAKDGMTALAFASRTGDRSLMELLLQAGARQ